ncbi:hypothetical protein BSKO_10815 [Bryopsis sp. KO-2023]|nr:hypothetical protein BSKO_10815 [Bryopsis sp. KO-2023]
MGYVKVVKNKAYFSRFQVKFKRRRQGKTDYQARRRLCNQDKNKYNAPKYRLVVRYSKKDITCQIVYAALQGDVTLCAAYAHELPKYGVKVGLTNYAAGYCTGLLLARRALTKFGLADAYSGVEEASGEFFTVEEAEDAPRPFYCVLDTGLAKTSTGAKVFACLKGAADGGLDIPHKENRFVGFDPEGKSLNTDVLRKYIYGGHVAEYMQRLRDEEPEVYEKQFSQFIAAGVEPEAMEEMYKKAHAAIRSDPKHVPTTKKKPAELKKWNDQKLSKEEKKERLKARLAAMMEEDE